MLAGCLKPLSTVFQLYRGGQYTYPYFPVVYNQYPEHYSFQVSMPLAAFTHNHCRDNGQRGGGGGGALCLE